MNVSWRLPLSLGEFMLPNGNTLFLVSANRIVAIQRQTGQKVWERSVLLSHTEVLEESITLTQNQINILTADGHVVFLNEKTGNIIRTVTLPPSPTKPVAIKANAKTIVVSYACTNQANPTGDRPCIATKRLLAVGLSSASGKVLWQWHDAISKRAFVTDIGEKYVLWYQDLTTTPDPGAGGILQRQRLPSNGEVNAADFTDLPVSAQGREIEAWSLPGHLVYVQTTPTSLRFDVRGLNDGSQTIKTVNFSRQGCAGTQLPQVYATGETLSALLLYVQTVDSCGAFSQLWKFSPSPVRVDQGTLDPLKNYPFSQINDIIWARDQTTWFSITARPNQTLTLPFKPDDIRVIKNRLLICDVSTKEGKFYVLDAKNLRIQAVFKAPDNGRLSIIDDTLLFTSDQQIVAFRLAQFLKN
jgi:prepilin-type processing-associated H-X9-DG protein